MESPKSFRENRPWGEFIQFTKNTPSTVKIITVNAYEATSLQKHEMRSEFWYIISGSGFLTIGTEKVQAKVAGEYFVAQGVAHRIEAGDTALVLLEISMGEFSEEDIERLEDRYNRI